MATCRFNGDKKERRAFVGRGEFLMEGNECEGEKKSERVKRGYVVARRRASCSMKTLSHIGASA